MEKHIETERKYLIEIPDIDTLLNAESCQVKIVEQTYLVSDNRTTRRIRKVQVNGTEKYVYTQKTRVSDISCIEQEGEISSEQYDELYRQKNPNLNTIKKTRYCVPTDDHIIEIDIYPFWNDRAILEIELSDENEHFRIPDFIKVIKEVSHDKRYKNINLARKIFNEEI